MKIAAIIPAYNEAARIAGVISAVRQAKSIDDIIVVNDGSTDTTAQVVRGIRGVCLIDLGVNVGKGGALAAGVAGTNADILVFLDADLIGLKPEQVDALVAPIKARRAKMSVGRFSGGRRLTDLSQRVAPNVSGQRAIAREVFEQIPGIADTRYGVEMAITRFCRYYRVPTESVALHGVTHPMKEEKLGFCRGWLSRVRMYTQILKISMDPRAPRRTQTITVSGTMPRWLRRLDNARRRGLSTGAGIYGRYRRAKAWRKYRSESRFE